MAALLQVVDGSSLFSMTYSVMKLPPSFSGGFQVRYTELSVIFSVVTKRGASGRSERGKQNKCNLSRKVSVIWDSF